MLIQLAILATTVSAGYLARRIWQERPLIKVIEAQGLSRTIKQGSVEECNEAIKQHQYSHKLIYQRALCYYEQKEYEQALADIAQAIRFYPLNPRCTVFYSLQAQCLLQLNRLHEAFDSLNKAIEFDPQNMNHQAELAAVHNLRKEYETARRIINRILPIEPYRLSWYVIRAEAYFGLEDYAKAELDFNKALAHHSKEAALKANQDLDNDAENAELDPNQVLINAKYAELYAKRGQLYEKMQQWQKALDDYTTASDLDAKNHSYHAAQAAAQYQINDLDGALKSYNKALECLNALGEEQKKEPEGKYHYLRGKIYLLKSLRGAALTDFIRAKELKYSASDLRGLSLLAGSENVSDHVVSDTLDHLEQFNIPNNLNFFLFIGDTGVGKSTLINYLAGKRMRSNPDKTVDVADGKELTKIGHSRISETNYPLPVRSEVSPEIYLDSVGFHDNRGTAKVLASAITIKWAVNSSKHINGVVLMATLQDFLDSRYLPIRNLLKTLVNLFKNLPALSNSIVLMINKVPQNQQKRAKAIVSDVLKNMLADHNNPNPRFNTEEIRALQKRKKILEILVNSRIVLTGVLDEGQMRETCTQTLKQLTPVDKHHFALALDAEHLQIFEDNFIYKVAVDGIRALKQNNQPAIKEQMRRFEFLKKIIIDLPSVVLQKSAIFSDAKSPINNDTEVAFQRIKKELPAVIQEFFELWEAYQKANENVEEEIQTRSYTL